MLSGSASNMGYVCGKACVGLMGYIIRSAYCISPSKMLASNSVGTISNPPDLRVIMIMTVSDQEESIGTKIAGEIKQRKKGKQYSESQWRVAIQSRVSCRPA
jgi:hypothetical protein